MGGRPVRSARFRLIRGSVNSMPVPPIQASRKNSSSSLLRILSVAALAVMVSWAISRSHQGEIDTMAPGRGCCVSRRRSARATAMNPPIEWPIVMMFPGS